ncbi:metallophosphatase family protein [Rhodopseudomonas sp. HC1]|uniref:metallophosphoesterase family protein n=1 Tax=Rhodopseudomonas infernalis TaxID=2897386 RepID=UPI001EE89E1E|nr:metallophosphoesterase family protein [Rhodopseudomonas infernalis]MCG6204120.1 metallophosphatase family protein [Rhodopseudomonas infernalis]
MTVVGIISDTHGLLRPEAVRRLTGVDAIIHAGDIGDPAIIETLRTLAPVTAIRGNIDRGDWARAYRETERVEIAGRTLFVLHDFKTLAIDPESDGVDVVVCGHSHAPRIETQGSVLILNPGSAGPRRFKLPVTLAMLELADGQMHAEIHELLR